MWDLAPHDLAIIDYCFNIHPKKVFATASHHFKASKNFEMAHITLEYANGFIFLALLDYEDASFFGVLSMLTNPDYRKKLNSSGYGLFRTRKGSQLLESFIRHSNHTY
jgi:predicted dehydrogenase